MAAIATMTMATTDRPKRPAAAPVAAATTALFLMALVLLSWQLRTGRDPVLGAGKAEPRREVVVRRIVKRTVVTRLVAANPPAPSAPAASAPAAAAASAPAPAPAAPAPALAAAPAPAPVVTRSS
jgi:hypothetical protein